MISFKLYIESAVSGLIPGNPNMSFEEFMQTLVGSTIKEILDKSSYINLYIGNKYGFNNVDASDANIRDFGNSLVAFVNKDILKHRPTNRVYETQEFKDKYGYDEYLRLSNERRKLFRSLIGKTGEERKKILDQKGELEDKISETVYAKAMRQAEQNYDDAVTNYHNTPLAASDLRDDGSPQYKKLKDSYNKLFGKGEVEDSDYIDV